MRRLDQDHARRIETESAEAMAMQPGMGGKGAERTKPVARRYKEEWPPPTFPPPLWGRVGRGVVRLSKSIEACD